MSDTISGFFEDLRRRQREPMLNAIRATVRFDIINGRQPESWRIAVTDGQLFVSSDNGAADCVITAERTLFEGVAAGRVNAMAALLRGELAVSGDPDLVVAVQRLFPGPSGFRTTNLTSTRGGQQP